MPVDAVITLILGALIIGAAALGLIRVSGHLKATSDTLETLDGGVQVIVAQTSTVVPTVASVNASLAPVRAFAESI
ncbi:MAG: hypothetical protein FJW97_06855 [Actinobacteria bacterium]|jgi:hypothetical protein|nr:hypothetical protein [Actinomycetota bacterium]